MKKLAFLLALVMTVAVLGGCGSGSKSNDENEVPARLVEGLSREHEGAVLNILNWGEYIDEEIFDEFYALTGITVKYYTTASNEEMLVKVSSPDSVIDICFPSDFTTERMIQLGLLHELDRSKLPNLKYIDERFLGLDFDKGNAYSVPYMWGTLGILYNTTLVDDPVTSWDILWNEKYSGKIYMYDSIRDTMAVALSKLGYSINSVNEQEVLAAQDALISQKPLVLAYLDDRIKDNMIAGEGALGVIYSGDAFWCIQENPDLSYAVPEEGSNLFCDAVVVLKNSKNPDAAQMFLNYLCDPMVSLANTNFIGYSTPNKEAMNMIDPEWLEDETYNPPAHIVENCEVFHYLGENMELYNKAWSRVKGAQ